MRRFGPILATCLWFAWLVPTSAFAHNVVAETFMIPAVDHGIQLYVRNKHLEGRDDFAGKRIVLFVHGATYPPEAVFDIDLPGGSWADLAARKGYDVYLVNVRSYGGSTQPPAMDGKATWEPEKIRVPTLLILAEWDQDTPLFMAQEVFSKLVNTPYRRHVVIAEGTHTVALEKSRMHLIHQIQDFLDE